MADDGTGFSGQGDEGAASDQPTAGGQEGPAAALGSSATAGKSSFVKFTERSFRKAATIFSGPLSNSLEEFSKDVFDEHAERSLQEIAGQLQAAQQQVGPSSAEQAAHRNRVNALLLAQSEVEKARDRLQDVQFVGVIMLPDGRTLRATRGLALHSTTSHLADALNTAVQAFAADQRGQLVMERAFGGEYPPPSRLATNAITLPSSTDARRALTAWVNRHVLPMGQLGFKQLCSPADGSLITSQFATLCARGECGGRCSEARTKLEWPDNVPCVKPTFFTKIWSARLYHSYAQHERLGPSLKAAFSQRWRLVEDLRHVGLLQCCPQEQRTDVKTAVACSASCM